MPAYSGSLLRSGCMTALALALLQGASANAQNAVPATSVDQAKAAEITTPADTSTDPNQGEILVTGSRIAKAGFNAPTPTTVLGDVELREGNRPSVAQVLNDQPAFRATSTPASTVGNTNAAASTADLRGLGAIRTLTLLNGHRFVGSLDLNDIPQNIIKRVEVVTGGASAAWGSGAVAGVVNIILDDDLEGFNLGAQSGISSRGDASRFSFDGTYGTHFAGGRGHFMISSEYVQENGAYGRDDGSRPNLDANLFTTNSGQVLLANNVNYLNATPGGVIMSGPLAGQAFNPNGTLSPVVAGSQSNASFNTIGGNSRSQYDYLAVTSPYKRFNTFGRASYEVSDALKISLDGNWSRIWSNFSFFPDVQRATATAGGFVIQSSNPFLSQSIRDQLSAAGVTSFRLGRILADIGGDDTGLGYVYRRDTVEGSISLDGSLGGSWKYDAYYDHGELRNRQAITHQRITANFLNAIDAVTNSSGQIVCRVALTDPSTPCQPLNIFGVGNESKAALAYAFGDASDVYKQTLNAAGASIHGDLFKTWAGPVSVAFGFDWRREGYSTYNIDPLSKVGAFGTLNYAALAGNFNVKEGFGEVVVPLLDTDFAKLDLNGAARYSDYSNSGGIWSWKGGGTLRIMHDLLLRGVYSRDIRSPAITELFTTRTTNITTVTDPFRNNETVSVYRYGGGNPALTPEIAHTLTLGGSYGPHFIPGLNMSLDYYKIDIKNVIATIAAQDAINQCYKGSSQACATIVRDSTGAITTLFATYQNIASYKTRGLDMEASYLLPLSNLSPSWGGSLRFRVLATYVDKLVINDGVNIYDRAGTVGDSVGFSTPHWKGTGGLTYQGDNLGVDLRVRYVGGGLYNAQQAIVNNKIDSRTYVDVGVNYKVGPMSFFLNVNNLFDRDPPYVLYTSAIYDVIGRYFSGGVRVKF